MKEELITLETAKLVKEKGFDIPCVWYYHDKCKEFPVEKGGGKIKVPLNWNSDDNGMTVKCYSAPTQSVLQRWLREEYSIHIKIDTTPNFDSTYKSKWRAHLQIPFKPFVRVTGHFYIEDTYEKVLETALKTALNEI